MTPAPETPHPMPSTGGSYIRLPDGSLVQTEPPTARAEAMAPPEAALEPPIELLAEPAVEVVTKASRTRAVDMPIADPTPPAKEA